MIVKNGKPYIDAVAGVRRKTLAYGEKGLMAEFALQAGAELPPHSHPHEQIGYLVSGAIVLTVDERDYTLQPGDSWAVAGDVSHKAKALADSVAIEVFVPVREDYRDLNAANAQNIGSSNAMPVTRQVAERKAQSKQSIRRSSDGRFLPYGG